MTTSLSKDQLPLGVVRALPGVAACGAVGMPLLGWALRDRLSTVDKAAFIVDAAGYAAAIGPLRRREAAGWTILAAITGAQPLFSMAKRVEGTGSRREAAGRAAATVVVIGALLPLRRFYRD